MRALSILDSLSDSVTFAHCQLTRMDQSLIPWCSPGNLTSSTISWTQFWFSHFPNCRFKTQANLQRHKEYHHAGERFSCRTCGRVYPSNSTLKQHEIAHSNFRPHKCNICMKTFKRNQDLKFHTNQHTGAKPYQCPHCPRACKCTRIRIQPFSRHSITKSTNWKPNQTTRVFFSLSANQVFLFVLCTRSQLPAPETASPIEDASTPTKQAKNCPTETDNSVKRALKFRDTYEYMC